MKNVGNPGIFASPVLPLFLLLTPAGCKPCTIILDERLRKTERIRRKTEFQVVLQQRGVSGSYCIIYVKPAAGSFSRVGLIVGRAIGTAVVRNRVKRRIREVFRRIKNNLIRPCDIVIRARTGIHQATYQHIADDILATLRSLQLLDPMNGPQSDGSRRRW